MKRRGFTLVELMVSIGLALLLMLAISYIFSTASQAVGAGQALSANVANNRAVQTVLFNDFSQAVIRSDDMPSFIIRSRRKTAFKDAAEALGDRDFQEAGGFAATDRTIVDKAVRTRDIDGNNIEGEASVVGELPSGYTVGGRNYRQDMMSFFARHLYPRQTGNDGIYVADMTSNEAYVWYGHVRQPREPNGNAANNMDPGWDDGSSVMRPDADPSTNPLSNPNNYYARQWGLGRVAILLREPDAGVIKDKGGDPQYYIRATPMLTRTPPNSLANTSPISQDATAYNGTLAEGSTSLGHSRYDLAGTSIDGMRTIIRDAIRPVTAAPPGGGLGIGGGPQWYGANWMTPRFAAYPFPTKPLSSRGAARTVPWLVGGCTNFIVEYAGDFLTQNATTGAVTGDYGTGATDGIVDFFIDFNGTRQVRWYGFPRDVGGITVNTVGKSDGVITIQTTPATLPASPDVLPLRDFLATATRKQMPGSNAGATGAAFERFVGSTFPTGNQSGYNGTTPALASEYVAAWQSPGSYYDNSGALVPDPPKPSMIRVTMTVDDPTGRLPEGQNYEYVITLP